MSAPRLARIPRRSGWYIVWSDRGRSRRCSAGTDDRGEAELFLAAFRLELAARGPDRDPRAEGIAAVVNAYVDAHAARLPSAVQARIAAAHVAAFVELLPVSRLDAGLVADYVAHRRAAGVTDGTIARELSVLRAALRRRYGAAAPTVKAPPAMAERTRWLTRPEAARLLRASAAANPWLATFVRLGLYTGARPGAILDLQWDRVDTDAGLIDLRLPGRSATNKRRAVVPIGGALLRHLRWARAHARDERVVPIAPITLRRSWGRARAAAGLPADVTPVTLRHTLGSWAAQAGVSLYQVGRMLGHSRPQTTARYAKLAVADLADVMRAGLRGRERSANDLRTTRAQPDAGPKASRQAADIVGGLVGAAGIEPATPTMSRKLTGG